MESQHLPKPRYKVQCKLKYLAADDFLALNEAEPQTIMQKVYSHFLSSPKKCEAKECCKPASESVKPRLSSVVVLLGSETRVIKAAPRTHGQYQF